MPIPAREIRVARRPVGRLSADDFSLDTVNLNEPNPGEVLVRNLWMTIDPYMRLSLTGLPGLHAPLPVGGIMDGAAIGVVEQSNDATLPAGAYVLSQMGWRDRFVAPAATLRSVDPELGPLSWRLGVLGLTGLTAYAGIEYVLKPEPGETIFISGAAGAVGSVACQLAKQRGCRVLGSAGSAAKVDWLVNDLGVDAAVNYKDADLAAFLRVQCPQGLDIFFDNVGGATLDMALTAMRPRGRIGLCGAISQYDGGNYRAGPQDFFTIIEKSLAVYGFNAGAWQNFAPTMLADLAARLKSGGLVWKETIVDGLENAPAAFAAMFDGANTGKLIVRLAE